MEVLTSWIDEHPDSFQERFNKQIILESAKLIFENKTILMDNLFINKYLYNEENICCCIPAYVTLGMGYFKLNFYESRDSLF